MARLNGAGLWIVTVTLDMSNTGSVGDLGVGYNTSGTLRIADGAGHVRSRILGLQSVLDRHGNGHRQLEVGQHGSLNVGYNGNGTLRIDGGTVSNATGYIGCGGTFIAQTAR